jgi:hydrogenase nickel insertion protein HypA
MGLAGLMLEFRASADVSSTKGAHMHELSLAQDVLRTCAARLNGTPGRLERVRLAVGELAAVEPDLLRFAWEAVTAGGPHEGAALEIEWHAARQVCVACGRTGDRARGAWLMLCAHCHGALRVEGGQELDVIDMAYAPTAAAVRATT